MDVGHRAKQFAPFAALRGLEETLQKQEIIYEFQKDLSEEKKNELDMKLRMLKYGMKIQVTFFARTRKDKTIGQYHTVTGSVEFFDPSIYLRVDDTEIQIQDDMVSVRPLIVRDEQLKSRMRSYSQMMMNPGKDNKEKE